jgi:hypothetical protein
MSTIDRVSASETGGIELVPNEDQGTVTFVADLDEDDETTPPTEWITVATGDTVDLEQYR